MKGLVLQGMYSVKKSMKIYLGIIAVYLLMGLVQQDFSSYSIFFLFFGSMLIMNVFESNQRSEWELYAGTMPVSKKQVIGSYYILAGIFLGISAGCTMLANIADVIVFHAAFAPLLQVLAGACMVVILYISVFIPILVHFGAEKGRLIVIGCYLVPFFIVYLLDTTFGVADQIAAFVMSKAFIGVAVLIVAGVFLISCVISNLLYSRKEF